MNERKTFHPKGPSRRLDRYLADELSPLSRTRVQALISDGAVTVNGRSQPARTLLTTGDVVVVSPPAFSTLPPAACDTIPVLFEDEHIVVVDKPAGLVVHPAGPHRTDTLVQRLWPKLRDGWTPTSPSSSERPGVVHRLDKGTSGVMVIAKNPSAAQNLSLQFADRSVKKVYWALAQGVVTEPGRIRSMVGRSRRSPQKMSTERGRWSETEFHVLTAFPHDQPPATLLEVRPRTGRTHQIRVQMSAWGHPLVGDRLYGASEGSRPMLHAHQLEFRHPVSKTSVLVTSPTTVQEFLNSR